MTTASISPVRRVPSRARARRALANNVGTALVVTGTTLVLVPLVLLLGYLVVGGLSSIDWDFFTRLPLPVGEVGGGVANAIVGTVVLILMAAVLGVGLGVAGGIYVAEYPESRLTPSLRLIADVLAGVPAIVMGLVAYGLVVTTMGRFSAVSGSVALGFLMIPIVVRTTEEVLKLVPRSVREAGYALGLPRWRVTLSIVLPAASGGIITGVMLSVARVAGEAAPLLFTAFGNQFWNRDLTRPIDALPLVIFRYSISPYEDWHRLASASALVLVVMILLTTLLARFATRRRA